MTQNSIITKTGFKINRTTVNKVLKLFKIVHTEKAASRSFLNLSTSSEKKKSVVNDFLLSMELFSRRRTGTMIALHHLSVN